MRIAFYAPLKPPSSPVPSGDRRIARLLVQALEAAGHDVTLASRFRAFEAKDQWCVERIRDIGCRLADRAARRFTALPPHARPEAVFTYHVYDKAPDWIGPGLAEQLGVPYVICEASLNPARATGALQVGYEGAKAAVAAADAILELNPADRAGVAAVLKPGARIWPLAPFTDRPAKAQPTTDDKAALAHELGLDPAVPWLLAVGMMRPGDKLTSYRLLAEALARIVGKPWQLIVVGDGAARSAVEDAFKPLGADKVRFLGMREGKALEALYGAADILAWPAVNEALGMAILEAQAHGLPVVAGRHGAIASIIEDGVTGLTVPQSDVAAFALALANLLDDPVRAKDMGRAAAAKVRRHHTVECAQNVIEGALRAAAAQSAARMRESA